MDKVIKNFLIKIIAESKFLIKISRFRFWLYEAGTFFIGYLIAAKSLEDFLNLNFLIYLFYFIFPANLLIYGINDIFDYETDKNNPKKVSYEALLLPEYHKKVYFYILIFNLPFLIYSFLNLNLIQNLFLILFLFFAIFYSAKPIRAKTIPILDSFFSASHYVFTGIFGYYLIMNQNLNFPILGFVFGILWAMAMHAYSAIPDVKFDKEAKVSTIATFLGAKKTIILCAFLYLSSFLILSYIEKIFILGYIPYLFLMILSLKNYDDNQKIMKLYKYFPYINTTLPMLWSIYYLTVKFGGLNF
ncbi:MAG: prenyltransferase [Candidatus Parcubacteria bacterium]|nr:MAG: prenyltransferase [Candidatus Parcubacteria bacterium]